MAKTLTLVNSCDEGNAHLPLFRGKGQISMIDFNIERFNAAFIPDDPDGELLVLEFFRPQNRLLGGLTRLWLRTMSFLFARRNAAAYAYLRESIDKTLSAEDFIALAERQGFVLETRHLFFPACSCLLFRGPDDKGLQSRTALRAIHERTRK